MLSLDVQSCGVGVPTSTAVCPLAIFGQAAVIEVGQWQDLLAHQAGLDAGLADRHAAPAEGSLTLLYGDLAAVLAPDRGAMGLSTVAVEVLDGLNLLAMGAEALCQLLDNWLLAFSAHARAGS